MQRTILLLILVFAATPQVVHSSFHREPILPAPEHGKDLNKPLILYSTISVISRECVLITGRTSFRNSVFIESCANSGYVKEIKDIGVIKDIAFPAGSGYSNGFVLLQGGINRISDFRILGESVIGDNKDYFNRIISKNDSAYWAVGDEGKFAYSFDSGRTWELETLGSSLTLLDIVFAGPASGWMIGIDREDSGEKQLLFRTDDAGRNWKPYPKQTFGNVHQVVFTSERNGWLVNNDGDLFTTHDGGNSWKKRNLGPGKVTGFFFLDDQRGWCLSGDVLLATKDGGGTWSPISRVVGSSDLLYSIHFASPENGWLFDDLSVLKTADGGKTWSKLEVSDRLSSETLD